MAMIIIGLSDIAFVVAVFLFCIAYALSLLWGHSPSPHSVSKIIVLPFLWKHRIYFAITLFPPYLFHFHFSRSDFINSGSKKMSSGSIWTFHALFILISLFSLLLHAPFEFTVVNRDPTSLEIPLQATYHQPTVVINPFSSASAN